MKATLVAAGIVLALALASLSLSLTAIGPRSALVRAGLKVMLYQRGHFHLARGAIVVERRRLVAENVEIVDRDGGRLFVAKLIDVRFDPAGLVGRGPRRLGLKSVEVVEPGLRLVRLPNGEFNISPLLRRAPGPARPAPAPPARFHYILRVTGGRFDFENPSALSARGRAFAVSDVSGVLHIDRGGLSFGRARGTLSAQGRATALRATLSENDSAGFAQAQLRARDVPVAPLIDGLIPTPFFAADAGLADVVFRAYAFDYAPDEDPPWRLSAQAQVRDGILRVRPLIVPAIGLHGPVQFDGQIVTTTGLRGSANRIPIAVTGGIQVFGGVRFALGVSGAGSLEAARQLFAFSKQLPVGGSARANLRIAGPLGELDVSGTGTATTLVTYGGIPLRDVSADFFYRLGHFSLPRIAMTYGRGRLGGDGDIDMSSLEPSGQFEFAGAIPAADVPIAGNVNPQGIAMTLLTMNGPLRSLSGAAFAQVVGGNGVTMRTDLIAGPSRFAVGPAIIGAPGGELAAAFGIDRPERTISGDIIATHAPLHLVRAAIKLPGITKAPITLPQAGGTIDGAIVLRGTEAAPLVATDARASRVVIGGVRVGAVRVVAAGAGHQVRIRTASIVGEDVRARAAGFASLVPHRGGYTVLLTGSGSANVARLAAFTPARGLAGHASGDFKIVLAAGRWLVSGRVQSRDAAYAGVPVRSARGVVGGGAGTRLYGATLAAAGGTVVAVGAPTKANPAGRSVNVWASGIDVGTLQPLGLPFDRGAGVAVGDVTPGVPYPAAAGAVALTGGGFRGRAVGGEANVRYASGVLKGAGSVTLDREFADVSGTISGLAPGRPGSGAALDLATFLRDADLGALVNPYTPASVKFTGVASGNLHVGGTFASPTLDGPVSSDTGTIRGVAYDDFRGVVHLAQGRLGVDNGTARIGSSQIAFSGLVSPADVHLRTSSSNLNLADFNDFFEGYDTLEGTGFVNAAFDVTPRAARATGRVSLRATSIVGFPVGAVDVALASQGGALSADVRANGPAGKADLLGTVDLPRRRAGSLDFRGAALDVAGRLSGVDLAVVAPHVGAEDYNLAGTLDAGGSVKGRLHELGGQAGFSLRNAHVGKIPVDSFTGTITAQAGDISLRGARLRLPFATAQFSGTRHRGGGLAGNGRVDAADLSKLSVLAGQPEALSGSAVANVAVSGSLRRPVVEAALQSGRGTLYGVAFDRLAARTKFAPGEFEIGDSELMLAHGLGTVSLKGALPLQLRPFGLGPARKPLSLRLETKGLQLAALDPLARGAASMQGGVNAVITAGGQAGHPDVAGAVQLRGVGVTSKWQATPVTDLDADLSLAHDSITLSKARGRLGSGTFEARGGAHIVPAVGLLKVAGLQYWTHLSLHDAQINVPSWINGTFNGELSLAKSGPTPYLAGTLAMRDGVVPFPAIYGLAARLEGRTAPAAPSGVPGVPKIRPGHIIVYGGEIYGTQHVLTSGPLAQPMPTGFALPSVDLAVTAAAERNVRVKGGPMDLSASGSIVVGGNLQSPTLAGAFTSNRGQVTYFDTNFRLLQGSVTFDPAEGLLPTLDVTARTFAGGEDITLVITGRIDNISTDLSADPPLARDQIIATLLHEPQVASALAGTPEEAQAALLTEAQTYFTAQLTRGLLFPFEEALAQSLNFEQVLLTFDPQGRVIIEVRKLITPRLAGVYRSTLTAPVTQSYGVAYSVRHDVAIELFQSQTPVAPQSFLLDVRLTFH